MPSEQAIVGVAIIATSFLWLSNELTKRGSEIWSRFFMFVSFLFMQADITIMIQIFRTESLFEMEEFAFFSLWNVIQIIIWIMLLIWIWDLFRSLVASLTKEKTERARGLNEM